MEFSNSILQEIESDSKALLEELALYSEEEVKVMEKNTNAENIENSDKKRTLINKSNLLLKKMKNNMNDEEYLLKGFNYHSKILYNIATKVPLVGKVIAAPLMAITKLAVDNLPPLAKIEQEKILNLYTSFKGDKIAIDTKIERLEQLQKLTNNQKDELLRLKKMSAELNMNMKRLEFNYKLSHIEQKEAEKKRNEPLIKRDNNYII